MIRTIARPMLASVFILDGVSVLRNPADRASAVAPAVERIEKTANKAASAKAGSAESAKPVPAPAPKTAVRVLAGVKIGAGALFAIGKAPRLSAAVLAASHAPNIVARFSDTPGGAAAHGGNKAVGVATDAALLGALFIAAEDTQGKPGLRWRAQAARGEVSAALPAIKGEAHSLRSALESTAHTIGTDARKVAGAVNDQSGNVSEALVNVTGNVGENLPENAKAFGEKASSTASTLVEKAGNAGQNLTERAKNVDAQSVFDDAKGRVSDFDFKAQTEKLRGNASPYLESALDQAKSLREEAGGKREALLAEAQSRSKKAKRDGRVLRKKAEARAKDAKKSGRQLRKEAEARAKAKAEAKFGK